MYEKNSRFSHLSKSERNEISILKRKGYSFRDIAKALNRSVSTICDEWNMGKVGRSYDPLKAHHKAYVRRWQSKYQGMKVVTHSELQKSVDTLLFKGESPPNISGRLKKLEQTSISKNSIYRYIKSVYGRKIEAWRKRRGQKRRYRRPLAEKLKDRTFIDKRPLYINTRKRIGDTEADFIVSGKSGKGVILVVVDRKSRVPFLEKILPVSIPEVEKALSDQRKI